MINFNDILIQSDIIEVLSRQAIVSIKPVKSEDMNVWVDYVEMIPAQDTDSLKSLFDELDPYDHSARFIAECTGKDYYVE